MKSFLTCLMLAGVLVASVAEAKIEVVTSTLDMGDLVRQVAGDRATVYSITKGQYDLHAYDPRPSEVMKLKRADLVVVAGMELDAFMPGLIDASRNSNVKFGKPGFVDPSKGVRALDVPEGRIDGRMGDVHPFGNPHFWFTPENVKVAVSNITEGLIRVDPEGADVFRTRCASYCAEVDKKFAEIKKRLAPYEGQKVIQYHTSWDYFCETFGLELAGSVEPRPGVPPSASHLSKLVKMIKRDNVKVALVEPYYPERPLKFLRKNSGIKALRLPLMLGGNSEKTTYLENLEFIATEIEKAFKQSSDEN